MSIQLIDAVHTILDKVKNETGKRVEFIEKNDLTHIRRFKDGPQEHAFSSCFP